MKRQFIFGMILAPFLLLGAFGVKILLKPSLTVDDAEQKIILEEMNYTTQYTRFSMPSFSFYRQHQGQMGEGNLADFRGKPTIVHVWATWCGPCVREMPEFIKFAKSYKKQYNIVSVNVDIADNRDETIQTAQAFLKEHDGKDLTVIFDHQGHVARSFGLPDMPATLFLDENGKELGRVNGIVFWDDPKMPLVIENLYKKKST